MASHFSVRAVAVSTVFVWSLAYAVMCAAQAPASPQLDAQRRVTVVFQGSKHVLRGRLVGRDANTLVIELDNPDHDGGPKRVRREIPMSLVKRVDAEHHDSVINGGILGALYLAACAKWWCGQGTSGPPPNPWAAAALGAVVGASFDAAFYGRTPIFEAKPTTAARLGPAFGFRFSF